MTSSRAAAAPDGDVLLSVDDVSLPFGSVRARAMQQQAQETVSSRAVDVPAVRSKVRRLSGGQRQAVAICRAAGFSSELVILDEPTAALGVQETARVEELVLRLRDEGHAGLQAACSRGLAFDADVSSEDLEVVACGEQLLQDSLQIIERLGGTRCTGALCGALGIYDRPLSDAGRRSVVTVLLALAKDARSRGMTLGLEICNRYETDVVSTACQPLALTDDIGEDDVLIHLDAHHMNIEEDDLVRPVHEVGDRLGDVHLGEDHRGDLGSGHPDLGAFFHALADVDCTVPITFEFSSCAVVAPGSSNDLAIWRNLWTDGEDLARHARSFTAGQLTASRR